MKAWSVRLEAMFSVRANSRDEAIDKARDFVENGKIKAKHVILVDI